MEWNGKEEGETKSERRRNLVVEKIDAREAREGWRQEVGGRNEIGTEIPRLPTSEGGSGRRVARKGETVHET